MAELEQAYTGLEKTVRELPRDRFDPQAVIEAAGREADGLFAWVRDNTAPLPYRGALRGSAGVLMERAGNSLDRSLLLAEILQSAGYEVRLANATLTKEQAQQLLQRILSLPHEPAQPTPDTALQQLRERVRARSEQIVTALGGLAADSADEQARLAAAVADYWWVQRQQAGKWIDLDVTGVTPPQPARTVPFVAFGRLPLDARDCHEVEFRAVIESFKAGKLQTDVVLKRTLRPAEVLGRPINFTHMIGKSVREEDLAPDEAARKRLKAALVAVEVYLPVLRLGDRPMMDSSFTTAGDVDRHPHVEAAGILAKPAGSAFGGFGSQLTGAQNSGPAKPSAVLTAEWIEYEIRVPGERAKTMRREVFDLIGPAARAAGVKQAPDLTEGQKLRRALMLLGQTQVLLQPCELPPVFEYEQMARQELRDKPIWLAVAHGGAAGAAMLEKGRSRLLRRDTTTALVAIIRGGLDPAFGRTFIDQPNVIQHRRWVQEAAGGELVARSAIDLAATSTAAAVPAEQAFRARVARGVSDTLAEQLALPVAADGENAIGVFEAAVKKGSAPVMIKLAGGDAALAKLNLPADAAARAKADLAAGNVLVLASAAEGRWAWWRVDGRSGQTVGVMDDGYNQALTEDAVDRQIAEYNETLGTKITKDELRQASEKQIEEWASRHPGNPAGAKENLMGMQEELIKFKELRDAITSGLLRGGFKG